jgi:hypothetical protein
MPKELRCGGTMHGVLSDDHRYLEVKCKRRRCGAGPGIVVLHTFDLHEGGKLIKTKKYRDPQRAPQDRKR